MAKAKRVIHVNAQEKTIKETSVSTLEEMQALVGGLIERVCILENGDEVYANEEGLLGSEPKSWFRIDSYPRPIAGSAYVIGSVTASGNNRPCKSTVDDIKAQFHFLKRL
jgi:hypothetical protein